MPTKGKTMTEAEFEVAMENGDLDDQYWEHVTDRGAGEIMLHEDAIFDAIESGKYFDSFHDLMVTT